MALHDIMVSPLLDVPLGMWMDSFNAVVGCTTVYKSVYMERPMEIIDKCKEKLIAKIRRDKPNLYIAVGDNVEKEKTIEWLEENGIKYFFDSISV